MTTERKTVLQLICDCKIKGQWQALAEQFGKMRADFKISKEHNIPVSTVRSARFYW